MADTDLAPSDQPPVFNYVLSFLLVGMAWGGTTPFIRRAAKDFQARQEAHQDQARATELRNTQSTDDDLSNDDSESYEDQPLPSPSNFAESTAADTATPQPAWMNRSSSSSSWLRTKIVSIFWTVVNLLRTPAYSIPLVINLTGSIWFFLLVGKHGELFLLSVCGGAD
jgi:hypothetical protein